MRAIEPWLLGYLLNSLWQIPLLFLAAWIAARLARPAGARMEHRVWVGALMLQIVLPACRLDAGELWRRAWGYVSWIWPRAAAGGNVRVTVSAGLSAGDSALHLPAGLLWALAAAYSCALLYFAGRLGWSLWRTEAMRRRAARVTLTSGAIEKLDRCGSLRRLGLGVEQIAISPLVSGPVTVGVRHRALLLPPDFLNRIGDQDLDAALAHEAAHMRRRDFAKNLLYEFLSLPLAYHPLLWLTRSRIAESREMVCDAMAAEAVAGRECYARSLLRLASALSDRAPARTLHAIGILDANIFERRVMNLTRKPIEMRSARRLAIAAACAVIALAACATALALRMNVDGPPATQSAPPTRLSVKPSDLAALILYKKQPIYPAEAKASHDTVNGTVVLAVKIGKDGMPEHVDVKKSLRNDYDQSALDAVREWRWKPYLLNGNPVEIDSEVNIVYSIEP